MKIWKKEQTRFYRCRPSMYKLIMYLNSSNKVEQYMLSKFLNEAYTVRNNLLIYNMSYIFM